MRRLLHLLLLVTVLLCGMDFCELAEAHESPALHPVQVDGSLLPGDDNPHTGTSKLAHAGHHHCPLAPDDHRGPAVRETMPLGAIVFARAVPAMRSLAQAPPTQPPTT